jgi:hypothetical protein
MALDYPTYVNQMTNLLVVGSTDPNFTTMLPGMIDYAEQRIYRELDLLHTSYSVEGPASSGNRSFLLPTIPSSFDSQGPFIVVDSINVITPSSATTATGTRNQLLCTSREFLNITYPSNSVTGVPQFYAMDWDGAVTFGPAPDAAYSVEVIGTSRPVPLSSAQSQTILTQYVPDLFIAASMVFGMGFQRDFSAQGDNPQAGVAWEKQYQTLFQSAAVEQLRARHRSEGWTSHQPSPIATPKRV